MRILMLGNSFIFTNHMPQMLADLTGAEVIHHTRGGARLSEQLNPCTRLGGQTQAVLQKEKWDYVVLQENNALIADVGWRCYEWSAPQTLYAADGVHPSELGSHIAAETIAAVIQQYEKEAQ